METPNIEYGRKVIYWGVKGDKEYFETDDGFIFGCSCGGVVLCINRTGLEVDNVIPSPVGDDSQFQCVKCLKLKQYKVEDYRMYYGLIS